MDMLGLEKRTRGCSVLFAVSALFAVFEVFAGEASAQALKAKSKQVVITAGDFGPYIGPKVENEGCAAEIVRAALKTQGYSVKFEYMPWARAYEVVKKGRFIASCFWADRPFRKKEVVFPGEDYKVQKDEYVFLRHKKTPLNWNGWKDLKGRTVLTVRGYSYTDDFFAAGKKYFEIKTLGNEEEMIPILLRGRNAIGISSRKVFESVVAKLKPEEASQLVIEKEIVITMPGYLVFSRTKEGSDLAKAFRKGLDLVKGAPELRTAWRTCGFSKK